MTASKNAAIAEIEMLTGLSGATRARIEEASGLQRFGRGSMIFREGERAHFIYGIVTGSVALTTATDEGEAIIGLFSPGETVLLPPALLDLPYMISARALSDGQALLIHAQRFRELAEEDGMLALACARVLARHWRILLKQHKQLRTQDADARLVQYLLENAGRRTGPAVLRLPGSKKDLATLLGVTPETLSRALRRLRAIGVESRRETIRIASLKRLADVAGDRGHPRTKDVSGTAPLP